MNNNPKEFISFSHDNLVFENKILEFAIDYVQRE